MSEKVVEKKVDSFRHALGKMNYLFMAIGVLIVIIGFILMSGGGSEDPTKFNEAELFSPVRITVAPIAVILGYIVVIFSIMWRRKAKA
ncbi:MAG: DUF3098 domain-containing protein [Flavobacteriales bacterium]|nr:DUF3098 domain-containing protein [Flavobacteriales bacterium]